MPRWVGGVAARLVAAGVLAGAPLAVAGCGGKGVKLVPVTLPVMRAGVIVQTILMAEAGAAFDELVRAGKLDGIGALWPTPFRRMSRRPTCSCSLPARCSSCASSWRPTRPEPLRRRHRGSLRIRSCPCW